MDKRLNAICGDAIEELSKLENGIVDLIVTDPPYNLNKNYGTSQDKLEFEEYLEFSRTWLNEAKRVLKQYSEKEKSQTITSILASFRLEGIVISEEKALAIFQKVQSRLQNISL